MKIKLFGAHEVADFGDIVPSGATEIHRTTETNYKASYGDYTIVFTGTGFTFGPDHRITGYQSMTGLTFEGETGLIAKYSGFSLSQEEFDGLIIPMLTDPTDDSAFTAWFNQEPFTLDLRAVSGGFTMADTALELTSAMTVLGSKGSDSLHGGSAGDTIRGGRGSDTIRGLEGADKILGGAGADDITGGIGADILIGGGGNDVIYGGDGADTINGGAGADTIYIGSGDAIVDENNLQDAVGLVLGGGGNDLIEGGADDDYVFGGHGADDIRGNAGVDVLYGGNGHDTITGGDGADVLAGDGGNDTIDGGADDDIISGDAGRDTLTGGTGADWFIFSKASDSRKGSLADTITDFVGGTDSIDLTYIGQIISGGLSYIGDSKFSGAAQVRVIDDGTNSTVLVDIDGDSKADMRINLLNSVGLSETDFFL